MKWRFPIFVSSALFAFVFGLFITTGDTYAANPTGIMDSSTAGQTICTSPDFPNDSPYLCSDYGYILFEVINYPDPYSSDKYFTVSNNFASFRDFRVSFSPASTIIDISNFTIFRQSTNAYSMGNGSIRWTLLVDYTESPTCPVCPEIPENPYDDKLDSIIQAIYVVAGTLLVLYFFYCIYRLIIRNSGVK